MDSFSIALIGECMIELQEIEPGKTQQTFGGDTLNTAIYMARLGAGLGVRADYVTALGTDSFSDAMVAFWEREGVGSTMVQRIAGELPGLYYIELDARGERVFHYWRGEAAAKQCFDYPGSERILERLADYDAIYLSGITLAILTPTSRVRLLDRLAVLAGQGKAVFFDCNYRPHLWSSLAETREVYRQMFLLCHTVLLTDEERIVLADCAELAVGEVHDRLTGLGVVESVVKGGAGPCSISVAGQKWSIPPQEVKQVVDTTAAGDSFGAAYLMARRQGCPPDRAVAVAHEVAAYVIGYKGAVAPAEGMPYRGKALLKLCS